MGRKVPMWRRYLTFWGRNIDSDLRDELDFHFEARRRELVDAGWEEEAAENEAKRQFGATEWIMAECHRIDDLFEKEKRVNRYMDDVRSDVLFAFRQFRRQPKFWAAIVSTLVIGVAVSTLMFAVVDGALLKPLPYSDPDRLVRLLTSNYRGEFVHLSEQARTMDLAAYYPGEREVTLEGGGEPVRMPAAGVSAGLFDLLGVKPVLGRSFTKEEMRPRGPGIVGADFWRTYGVVIISNEVWQGYFGGRPTAVGATLLIDNVPHTVAGVMPASFNFPSRDTAFWFPHNIDPADTVSIWSGNVAAMIGRLRGGYDIAEARQEVQTLVPTFRELIPWGEYMPADYGTDVDVRPLSEDIVGEARPVLMLLLASIGVVLLVLSVNIANMLLARGVSRERELATRAALGASRRRLVRQLLVESLVVALTSGVMATVVSWAGLTTLVTFLPPDLPRMEQIAIDGRVLLFALCISVGVGVAFGVLPAIRSTRRGRSLQVTGNRRLVTSAHEGRVTQALASLELALAVVLLISAGLLIQSLWNLSSIEPGFRVDGLVAARISPPGFGDENPAAVQVLARSLREGIEALPAVESVTLASAIPFEPGLHGNSIVIEGQGDGQNIFETEGIGIDVFLGVDAAYFNTMSTRILDGRAFIDADGFDGPRVAVVSEGFARAHWGDRSPVGTRIKFRDDRQYQVGEGNDFPWFTVVGVAEDVRFSGLSRPNAGMVYVPLAQYWEVESLNLVARSAGGPSAVAGGMRAVVADVSPGTPIDHISSYETRLGDTIARPRFAAYVLGGFAGLALLLASIGVHGVLLYAMHRRIPEIGVRMAFGATQRQVFRLLFGQGIGLTVVGIAVGLPAALASTQLLSGLLFGVEPADYRIFAFVAGSLLVLGLAVSYVPARRATRVDPMAALRRE